MPKKKLPMKSEKKLSLKSWTRKQELLKLAQMTQILAEENIEPELRQHLEKRAKELSLELFV